MHLVEWVGSGAPVGQEQAEANSLKDTADNTDSNQVKRSLFADDLSNELDEGSVKIRMERMDCTYTWTSGSEEDQATEVGSPLVAQSTSSIEQSAYTVRLETRADDRRAPAGSCGCRLLGLEELLLGVSCLSAVVGIAKQRSEDSSGGDLGEDDAKGDRGWLDRGKVYCINVSLWLLKTMELRSRR